MSEDALNGSSSKRRSAEEKLAEIERKMDQLKARKQRIQNQLSQKERKERTRRLIQVGAIFEKHFPNLADLSLDQVAEAAGALRQLAEKHKAADKEDPVNDTGSPKSG